MSEALGRPLEWLLSPSKPDASLPAIDQEIAIDRQTTGEIAIDRQTTESAGGTPAG